MINATVLNAHYDGINIILDEKYPLKLKTKILVAVFPEKTESEDVKDFFPLSISGLESAYGKNEPIYTIDMIREPNPTYERN